MNPSRKDRIEQVVRLGYGMPTNQATMAWDNLIAQLTLLTEPMATNPRFDALLECIRCAADRAKGDV